MPKKGIQDGFKHSGAVYCSRMALPEVVSLVDETKRMTVAASSKMACVLFKSERTHKPELGLEQLGFRPQIGDGEGQFPEGLFFDLPGPFPGNVIAVADRL